MRGKWGRGLIAIALVAGCQSAGVVVAPTGPSAGNGPSESSFATIPEPPTAAPPSSASASASASVSVSVSESPSDSDSPFVEAPHPVCTPQQPFDFLVRHSYIPVKTKKKEFKKTLEWRTKEYGFVKGWGDKKWNASLAKDHVVGIELFGLPVRVHERIVPALRCAEEEIKLTCAATPYTPGVLSGIRDKNTYHGGEVTNHLWGIALDIDPKLNPCCGCTKKWKASPLCKKKVKEEFERMAMPKCWVDAFEKYGFYWLGHDTLKDTMHFEFLGDPGKVMQMSSGSPASVAGSASAGGAGGKSAPVSMSGSEELEEEE